MAKYKFSEAERQAIFNVHGPRCYINNELLTMKTVEIDHIVPESLEDDPEEFRKVLKQLGLPDDFKVNAFENWMPACRACNGKKLAMPWQPSLLVQLVLQRAREKAESVRRNANRLVTDKQLYNALSVLTAASEQGELPKDVKEKLRPLVMLNAETREKKPVDDPIPISPSYSVPLYEILSDDGRIEVVRGPYGIGGGPAMTAEVPSGMRCGNCGFPFFNGARCVICGQMDCD